MPRAVAIGAAIFMAGIFVAVACAVVLLRTEIGDTAQPYSSFRADPIGTRVLYEALDAQPGLTLSRNTTSMGQIGTGKSRTLLLLGLEEESGWVPIAREKMYFQQLRRFSEEGGRLILAFTGTPFGTMEHVEPVADGSENSVDGEEPETSDEVPPSPPPGDEFSDFQTEFGFGLYFVDALMETIADESMADVRLLTADVALPEEVPWRSPFAFDLVEEAWRPVYSWDGDILMIERQLGLGSVVVMTDSYLLSNEAMEHARHPLLLAWLLGGNTRVVFDEHHLGASTDPGIAALVRRYGLTYLLAALALLTVLFFWRNAFSLIPRRQESDDRLRAELEAGRESSAALVNLLRRTVPASQLMWTCYETWRNDFGRDPRYRELKDRLAQEAAAGGSSKNIAARYAHLCRVLNERSLGRGQ